jgi:hypothetical protein
MRHVFAWFAVLWVLEAPAQALAQAAVPRAADGHPDLQGVWSHRWVAPLERPAGEALVVSRDEAEAYARTHVPQAGDIETPFFGPEARGPLVVQGEYRSSLLIDPADGLIPWTPAGQARVRAIVPPRRADDPEERSVNERCIGGSTGRAPILSSAVGNTHQIVQTPDALVLLGEYNPEVRIVPLDGRNPAMGLQQGESRGRWEGDTLVVETTNFRSDDLYRAAPGVFFLISPHTRIIERFTRLSADAIGYVFTVEDQNFYLRPWTAESMLAASPADRIWESACHEGNYSLTNMLKAQRVIDARTRRPPQPSKGSRR